MLALFIVQLLNAVRVTSQIQGKVVHGDPVNITQYAHSAFLLIRPIDGTYVCGSSILNQRILLTAGHCIENCAIGLCRANAFVGRTEKFSGLKLKLNGFILHEDFEHEQLINDIGLVAIDGEIELGDFVQRVSIMKNRPHFEKVAVAGWGLIDEMENVHTQFLHQAWQSIWTLEECRKTLVAPKGTFCGVPLQGLQYPAEGDSGSALVADNFIQLGIVSLKIPEIAANVIIYTDVHLFYDWILNNSKKLYCST